MNLSKCCNDALKNGLCSKVNFAFIEFMCCDCQNCIYLQRAITCNFAITFGVLRTNFEYVSRSLDIKKWNVLNRIEWLNLKSISVSLNVGTNSITTVISVRSYWQYSLHLLIIFLNIPVIVILLLQRKNTTLHCV